MLRSDVLGVEEVVNLGTTFMGTRDPNAEWITYRLFGLTLASDFHLSKRVALLGNGAPDLTLTHTVVDALPGDRAGKVPVYISPYKNKYGESILRVYRQGECYVLHFTNTITFYVWPDRIEGYQLQRVYRYEVEKWLIGTILALWLERKGTPVLHASAVVNEGAAIAFLGSNTAGKSSLAAAMLQCGHPLLTDDFLAITQSDTACIGQPGYPQMRMWPDLAEHFLGHYEDLELVHPDASKRTVIVGPEGWGTFCDIPQPIGCLYIPERCAHEAGETTVEITPVSHRDALVELLRYSFSTRLLTATGLQAQRLKSLAQIVKQVPIRRISYPSGLEHLPRVCQTILKDVSSLHHH